MGYARAKSAQDDERKHKMQHGRLIIEVFAGLIPGKPLPEHTRQWAITQETWDALQGDDEQARQDALDEWDKIHGWAREYSARLMNPRIANWVSFSWLWL